MKRLVAVGLALGLTACGRGDGARSPARDTAGMHMGMGNAGAMMSGTRAHMDSMVTMPPDRMKGMMAGHERRMSEMMDRMGAEMRRMNMPADRGWSALADSVRQDLAELPRLEGDRLTSRMRAHSERVSRLLGMHARMMESMQAPR